MNYIIIIIISILLLICIYLLYQLISAMVSLGKIDEKEREDSTYRVGGH